MISIYFFTITFHLPQFLIYRIEFYFTFNPLFTQEQGRSEKFRALKKKVRKNFFPIFLQEKNNIFQK